MKKDSFYRFLKSASITWVEAWKPLLSVFNDIEEQWDTLTQETLRGLVKNFLADLPESIKLKLKIAPDTGAA